MLANKWTRPGCSANKHSHESSTAVGFGAAYVFVSKKVGGRDRDRTGDPLLAKQTGKNTKGFVWCRLYGKLAKLKCPEVVPNFSAPLNLGMQFHVSSAIGNLRDCTVGALKPLSFTLLT